MATTPPFEVYAANGEYLASCKRPEEAVALVALLGHGATVRYGHRKRATLWREGAELRSAASHPRYAADIMRIRADELSSKR